jgi:hypothetical protein
MTALMLGRNHSCLGEAGKSHARGELARVARSVHYGVNPVSFRQGFERGKGDANARPDARDDQSLFARFDHRSDKIFVFPGVDLSLAANKDGVRRGLVNFGNQRTFGPSGTEAEVMTGTSISVASFARATVLARIPKRRCPLPFETNLPGGRAAE